MYKLFIRSLQLMVRISKYSKSTIGPFTIILVSFNFSDNSIQKCVYYLNLNDPQTITIKKNSTSHLTVPVYIYILFSI